MRIIVWAINYAPELTGIGPFNKELCEFLAADGHDVEIVTTFPYYPSWRKRPENRWRFSASESCEGVRIDRCWHYVPTRPSLLKRILHEASFVATSFLRVLGMKRPDLFIVVSPPLLLGAAATVACWIKKVPYVFHVQDLQPDAALGLEMVKPGLFTRLLYGLESFAYRHAALVSGISEGMMKAFERKGVPKDKRVYFPNGVRLSATPEIENTGTFRKRHNLSNDDFLAVYSGNLGVKQGLEIVIEAARLSADPRLRFVICGEGAQRTTLQRRVQELGLKNVSMLPLQPAKDYHAMLADADLCLVTQMHGSGQAFLPSKLLNILAAAKPVVAVADEDSAVAVAVKQGRFGLSVPPEDPAALLEAIEDIRRHPDSLESLGHAGRSFVEQFAMDRVLRDFCVTLGRTTATSPLATKATTDPRPSDSRPSREVFIP